MAGACVKPRSAVKSKQRDVTIEKTSERQELR